METDDIKTRSYNWKSTIVLFWYICNKIEAKLRFTIYRSIQFLKVAYNIKATILQRRVLENINVVFVLQGVGYNRSNICHEVNHGEMVWISTTRSHRT